MGGAAFGAQAAGAAWITRLNNPVTRKLVQSAVSAGVEGGFDVASNGLSQAWTTGFEAYQEGGNLSDAFGKAWNAGVAGVTDPSQITASLLNIGVEPAKAKFLEPFLESRVTNQVVRAGADVAMDTLTDTVGQSGGAFVAAYSQAIKDGKSPSEAFAAGRSAAGDAFKPENIAMSAFMNTAGNIANKGAERVFGNQGGAGAPGLTPKPDGDTTVTPTTTDGTTTTTAPLSTTKADGGDVTVSPIIPVGGPTNGTTPHVDGNDGKHTSLDAPRTVRPQDQGQQPTTPRQPVVDPATPKPKTDDQQAPIDRRATDPNRTVETDADVEARRVQAEEADLARRRGDTEAEAKARHDEVARDLEGDRGHAGIEVHSHFLGNVEVDVIRQALDRAGMRPGPGDVSSYEPLLREINALNDEGNWPHQYDAEGRVTRR